MEVFPIQSNPGGVTEELITHGKNGLLISNVNSETELIDLTFTALKMVKENRDYVDLNLQIARERLDYEVNRTKILGVYKAILKS